MSEFKTDTLDRADIITIIGAGHTDYGNDNKVLPLFKGGHSNATVDSASGDYSGGNRIIGFPFVVLSPKIPFPFHLRVILSP